jgi:Flp pilus assembly protein TadG
MRAASVAHAGARAARDRPLASGGSDAGSAAAEIVILTPLLVVLALLFVIGGRLASGLQDVGDAARTSVESAVIASTPSAAQAQARRIQSQPM